MTITLSGLILALLGAIFDPRPTIQLGCSFLSLLFFFLLLEELWFLYTSHRDEKE